jgi:hypothetical protein
MKLKKKIPYDNRFIEKCAELTDDRFISQVNINVILKELIDIHNEEIESLKFETSELKETIQKILDEEV